MSALQIDLKDVEIRPFHPQDAAQHHAIVSHPQVAEMLMQVPSMELVETETWPNRPSQVATDWSQCKTAVCSAPLTSATICAHVCSTAAAWA